MNALGIIEFDNVAKGYKIVNEMSKNVSLKNATTMIVPPHKLVFFIGDNYQNIEFAMEYAITISNGDILDLSIIGRTDFRIHEYLHNDKQEKVDEIYYLGLFSKSSIASGIATANDLLLNYDVTLLKLDFKNYMHGTCLVVVTGNIGAIQKAIDVFGDGELVTMPEKHIIDAITGG